MSSYTIPIQGLLITQTLNRELAEYRVRSPVARAADQLHALGKDVRIGQKIHFLYTKTKEGVHAWDLPGPIQPTRLDTIRYKELLLRAVHEILQPSAVGEQDLRNWIFSQAS